MPQLAETPESDNLATHFDLDRWSDAIPTGPLDTQIHVPQFCPVYTAKKRPISEKKTLATSCFLKALSIARELRKFVP